MNFKKRVNGSWTDTPHYIHKTDTDTLTTLPADIYPNDTTATVGLKGQTVQTGTPTPDSPVMSQGCGNKTVNLFSSVWEQGSINAIDGQNVPAGTIVRTKDYIPIKPNTAYSFSRDISKGYMNVRLYRADKSYIGSGSNSTVRLISGSAVSNPMANGTSFCCFEVIDVEAAYIRFNDASNNTATKWLMVEGEYTQETMPEFEPFGVKIPILSGGENLFDYPQDNYSTTINSVVWTIENGVIKGEGFTTSQGEQDCILVRKNGLYRAGNYPNYYSLNASTDMKLPAGTYTFSYIPITEPTMISSRPRLIIGHEGGRYTDETAKFVWNGDTFTVDSDDYVALALNTSNSIGEYEFGKFMLNLGATALPYEPYNRTTTPIYLGEVPTTRRIKKLVLTGEEDWTRTINGCFYINAAKGCPSDYLKSNIITVMCSHYAGQKNTHSGSNEVNDGCVCFFTGSGFEMYIGERTITSASDFKAYLQQQYSAGTPVTVWYVLSEPQTAVVNEPLRKIGDYADTVSYEQAGVQIPTNRGNTVIDVLTELKPSEVSLTYTGWHDATVKEWGGSEWEGE